MFELFLICFPSDVLQIINMMCLFRSNIDLKKSASNDRIRFINSQNGADEFDN